MSAIISSDPFNENSWEQKEFDWTGKAFYFVSLISVFNRPVFLSRKLEQLNREIVERHYIRQSKIILIQYGMIKSRVMIEIQPPEQYDAQVVNLDDRTNVDTMIYKGPLSKIGDHFKLLAERVTSKRGIEPRSLYYSYAPNPAVIKRILFAFS